MQRNDGRWHIEETWPPEDLSILQVPGDGGNQRVSSTSGGFEITQRFLMGQYISQDFPLCTLTLVMDCAMVANYLLL